MFIEYQLTNFKAFGGTETIPIRPITLIYGPNSSGKSSILQSLLLLKQTLEEAESPETLLLPKGTLVNLGGYREFVHRHDLSRPFSFKVMLENPKEASPWNRGPNRIASSFANIGLKVTFSYEENTTNAVIAAIEFFLGAGTSSAITYEPTEPGQLAGRIRRRSFSFHPGTTGTLLKVAKTDYEHPFWKNLWERSEKTITKDVLPEVKRRIETLQKRLERYQDIEGPDPDEAKRVLARRQRSKHELERELKSLESQLQRLEHYTYQEATQDFSAINRRSFLSCRGFLPVEQVVLEQEREPDTAIADFWELIPFHGPYMGLPDPSGIAMLVCSVFRRALESTIYLGPLRDFPERHYVFSGNLAEHVGKSGKMVPDVLFKNPALLKRVNEQFEKFGVEYELRVSSGGAETLELHDVFALGLFDKVTRVNVSILDVGFGISQVLPIIVQSMLSQERTLCIEQPEIHLHPKLQAELGSLLVECIKKPYSNRFIIETHSEHLLLRLQRLIREGKLKSTEVAVVYVDRALDGSKCLHMRLDEEGDFIDEWPEGFFEESYRELFN